MLIYERRDKAGNRALVVLNFAPCDWHGYRMPVNPGKYTRVMRTSYYGWDQVPVVIESEPVPARNKTDSLVMDVENMSGYIFLCEAPKRKSGRARWKNARARQARRRRQSPRPKRKRRKQSKEGGLPINGKD